MDKNDMNYNFPPYMGYENMGCDPNIMNDPNMFNPVSQYEQTYMYYRYLTQQMEYKIKCKEYERLCNTNINTRNDSPSRPERRIE